MKKIFLPLLFVSFLQLSFASVCCQQLPPNPEPYWIIESNLKTPEKSIVYFYTASHVLMYKESVEGRKLNVNKRKTVKQLNAALTDVLVAWQKDKKAKQNEQIIARRF